MSVDESMLAMLIGIWTGCFTMSYDLAPHAPTMYAILPLTFFYAGFHGHRASTPSTLLNYYGTNYGTFLGHPFASMSPKRVVYMALNGVLHPEGYLSSFTTNNIKLLHGVISAFFIYCHKAVPAACAYDTGSSARHIYERFKSSFEQLNAQKAREEHRPNATDIELALIPLKK